MFCQATGLGVTTLVLSGGVARNQAFRDIIDGVAATYTCNVVAPPPWLCQDNGLMIAWTGLRRN